MNKSGQYLKYEEYKLMGGTLEQTPFNLLEFEARRKIDEITQGRLKGTEVIPEEVIMCMFALINSLVNYSYENNNNKNVASESVGSYSISYVTGSQIQEIVNSKNIELNNIIKTYLTGVIVNGEHIIYLGVK